MSKRSVPAKNKHGSGFGSSRGATKSGSGSSSGSLEKPGRGGRSNANANASGNGNESTGSSSLSSRVGSGGKEGSGGGKMTIFIRLLFLLVPMIQMLWTAEAPRRPFGSIRDPETGLFRMKKVESGSSLGRGGEGGETSVERKEYEIINPRVLTVITNPRSIMQCIVTLSLMCGTERREFSEVFVLSVSPGKGEGEVEGWNKALDIAGVEKDRRFVLDAQEENAAGWDPEIIAQRIEPFVIENAIDTILTYDPKTPNPYNANVSQGVTTLLSSSSLASHISLLASKPTTQDQNRNKDEPRIHPRAYHLVSHPAYRSFLGPLLTPIFERFALAIFTIRSNPGEAHAKGEKVPTVFAMDLRGYGRNWLALGSLWKYLDLMELASCVFGRDLWVNQWIEA